MNKAEHEFLYNFNTSYEAVRKEKGFIHKQMAKEMNITPRYLQFLRHGGTVAQGGRLGVKGKGKIALQKIKEDYEEFFKLVHFLIMVYYESTEKYRFAYKQRRVNIIKLKAGTCDEVVFKFGKGEIERVEWTTKKSEIPDIIFEMLRDYNKKDIMNYHEMINTALQIKQEDRFIDLI